MIHPEQTVDDFFVVKRYDDEAPLNFIYERSLSQCSASPHQNLLMQRQSVGINTRKSMHILKRSKINIEENYMQRRERMRERREEDIALHLEQGRKIQMLMLANTEQDNMRAY